ncbi:hypothetical protein PHMEG_00032878 [Phytophthora megakarya]|uniref:Reverse transcriptase n=1 Tax=Phytophthora megakarya TaxID=4795 RepID=A0A225UV31_9STRA|nr:hypothetical protein PHMEG_00032878 [Phytophthora megakarya]
MGLVIVIVLKKNGQDIRQCIDYKMVNTVRAIMKYAMPLVDDLLTELESYLCQWMLGYIDDYESSEVGLKNAPMIYQRMLDNAFLKVDGTISLNVCKWQKLALWKLTNSRTKFHADRVSTLELDPVLRLVNDHAADMFTTNEPNESTLIPVFQRRSLGNDICFGGTTFDDCLNTLDKLLNRFEECRISVSFTKSIFCQSKVDFLTHEI